jgi:predicted nucleic acid-binding protein
MSRGLLIDSGPLVALLSRRDQYHSVVSDAAKNLHGPFLTWPVITEAAYLLKLQPIAVHSLLAWIKSSHIQILPLSSDDVSGIATILKVYADQSFDFADAVLMHIANRDNIADVFTLDHRHFSVFRLSGGATLSIVPRLR